MKQNKNILKKVKRTNALHLFLQIHAISLCDNGGEPKALVKQNEVGIHAGGYAPLGIKAHYLGGGFGKHPHGIQKRYARLVCGNAQ